jgi:hypothetical protein
VGKPSEILRLLAPIADGQYNLAVTGAGGAVRVTGSLQDVEVQGLALSPRLKAAGTGVGLDVRVGQRNPKGPPAWRYDGTATQAWAALSARLGGA